MGVCQVYLMSAVSVLLIVSRGTSLDMDFEQTKTEPDLFIQLLPDLTSCCHLSDTWNNADNTHQNILLPAAAAAAAANSLPDQVPGIRVKKSAEGPSLSIVNPLDVLRQRLLLEMARRQMRESQKQMVENRKFMKTIGKRGSTVQSQNPYGPYTAYNPYDPYEVRRSSLLV